MDSKVGDPTLPPVICHRPLARVLTSDHVLSKKNKQVIKTSTLALGNQRSKWPETDLPRAAGSNQRLNPQHNLLQCCLILHHEMETAHRTYETGVCFSNALVSSLISQTSVKSFPKWSFLPHTCASPSDSHGRCCVSGWPVMRGCCDLVVSRRSLRTW